MKDLSIQLERSFQLIYGISMFKGLKKLNHKKTKSLSIWSACSLIDIHCCITKLNHHLLTQVVTLPRKNLKKLLIRSLKISRLKEAFGEFTKSFVIQKNLLVSGQSLHKTDMRVAFIIF